MEKLKNNHELCIELLFISITDYYKMNKNFWLCYQNESLKLFGNFIMDI